MSTFLTFGRFKKVDENLFSEDVKDLYKSKDDSSEEIYNINAIKRTENPNNMSQLFYYFGKSSDSVYLKMSDHERKEKGLPTSLDNFIFSPKGIAFFSFVLAFGASRFANIYSPNGVIIRNSIKTSWPRYL